MSMISCHNCRKVASARWNYFLVTFISSIIGNLSILRFVLVFWSIVQLDGVVAFNATQIQYLDCRKMASSKSNFFFLSSLSSINGNLSTLRFILLLWSIVRLDGVVALWTLAIKTLRFTVRFSFENSDLLKINVTSGRSWFFQTFMKQHLMTF